MPVPLEKFSKRIIQRVFFVLNCKCTKQAGGAGGIRAWRYSANPPLNPHLLRRPLVPPVIAGGWIKLVHYSGNCNLTNLSSFGPDWAQLIPRLWPIESDLQCNLYYFFPFWRLLKFAYSVLLWDDVSDLILWKVAWLIIILVRGWVAPSFLTWRVWRRRRWTIWWTTPWAE